MLRISTLSDGKRMGTRELLLAISSAVRAGEHDFYIAASGQHDIGGPLWSVDGQPLNFEISNPGQRVGAMCLPGTRITVEGSAPADVGWLNSGGTIIVKGDAGDTSGHCAAAGNIYIGGASGARTGALMKHDPDCAPPQIWILKNTGSFSFEFMGGGLAVVCGHNCMALPAVLGDRPCVGMVGGCVYFRGNCGSLPNDAMLAELDENDCGFLEKGLDDYLAAIGKPQLKQELSIWKHWHKLVPNDGSKQTTQPNMAEFKKAKWFESGLFADLLPETGFTSLVPHGAFRLRAPFWDNVDKKCADCLICLKNCPEHAIKRRQQPEMASYSATERCIGCGICAAICPHEVWKLKENI